ncbi:MAG: UbiA family prenyltransferase [Bacteroidota bacterium]|nr:UbiA family prenyltransferase [Bacteroidota bacterium]
MWYFDKNTIKLLRIPFSFFLMPVYFFALFFASSIVPQFTLEMSLRAMGIFIILHVFIYPASNGYNSYHDQDTESIGGIKNPPKATLNLLKASKLFDTLGLILAVFINVYFFIGLVICVLVSRAYSYRNIRLKKYPIIGYASVALFQGGAIFFITVIGIGNFDPLEVVFEGIWLPTLTSICMIGGVYPLTQIYQHQQDADDNVHTISMLVGYRGTFVLSGIMFGLVGLTMFLILGTFNFILFQLFLLPVVVYFGVWLLKVSKDITNANFEYTMRMNTIAAAAMNLCFITLICINFLG